MRIDGWTDVLLHILFFCVPLIVVIVGLFFVGKETPRDDRFWRFGKNDPFRRMLYKDDGEVRETIRMSIILFLATVLLVIVAIGVLYGG